MTGAFRLEQPDLLREMARMRKAQRRVIKEAQNSCCERWLFITIGDACQRRIKEVVSESSLYIRGPPPLSLIPVALFQTTSSRIRVIIYLMQDR